MSKQIKLYTLIIFSLLYVNYNAIKPFFKKYHIYPRKMKTYVLTKTCKQMFLALFIITKHWKQPKCPSIGKQADKMSYVHTMEYYLAIKGMNYKYMLWHGWTSKTWCSVKEIRHNEYILYDSIYMTTKNKHNLSIVIEVREVVRTLLEVECREGKDCLERGMKE